ncbi:MAG: phospholipase A [Tepidisphaeraceae bacterium]
MNRLIASAVALLLGTSSVHAAPTVMLAPVDQRVSINDTVLIDLVLLNDGSADEHFVPERRLACNVVVVDERKDPRPGTLVLQRESTDAITIAPHNFARVRYALVSRDLPAGPVRVTLDGAASTAAIDLVPATQAHPSTTTPVPSNNPVDQLATGLKADPNFQTENGLVEYLAYRIKPHEPMYFLVGPDSPNAKFQISLKYQVFDPKGEIAHALPGMGNLFLGYTQLSFWDLEGESKPFFDNNYKPEVLFNFDEIDRYIRNRDEQRLLPDWVRLDFQTGLMHESNGRSGIDSRSMNIAYVRPTITFGDRRDWFVSIGPRVWMYLEDSENPDIADYRGHTELRVVAGQGGGFQLAATGRLGDGADQGSLQLDASFPIRKLTGNSFDLYLHAQYFTGYGESLLNYNKQDTTWRVGVSLVR